MSVYQWNRAQICNYLICAIAGMAWVAIMFSLGAHALTKEEKLEQQIMESRCLNWSGVMPEDIKTGYCKDVL